jgi:phosphoglycolate phosphatase-like HAD superfamily hydrolase
LRRVLACFDVEPVKAVMVGDGNTDIEAGKGAGVHTCGVTYGLGRIEELREAKPDFLIDDLRQLTEHFC